ncbi:trypsin-like serine protease [Streptomyces sp. NPDC057654]|uniref:trypsin-like serine protease n=1 Tax=Streptomyces sp. NPDC057654 TaxID=3346196 RepID=UPI003696BBC5
MNTPWSKSAPHADLPCVLSTLPLLATIPVTHAVTGDSYASTAKLTVGDGVQARSCSGVLVDSQWVMSAASCFADTPGAAVTAGAPKLRSTATERLQSPRNVKIGPLASCRSASSPSICRCMSCTCDARMDRIADLQAARLHQLAALPTAARPASTQVRPAGCSRSTASSSAAPRRRSAMPASAGC